MRQPRIKIDEVPAVYHCISRIVGAAFLLEGEREKEVLRNQIWKVADFCGVEVLTYCIMSNHVHVLVRTPHEDDVKALPDKELMRRVRRIYGKDKAEVFVNGLNDRDPDVRSRFRANLLSRMGDVSQFMKELKQRFSIWYNRSHRRAGTLWAERFKSVLVQDDSFALMTMAAYIDLNPVRAGLVDDPSQYRFCGYAEAMGGFRPARKGIVKLMGKRSSWESSVSRYRQIVFGKQASPKLLPSRGTRNGFSEERLQSAGDIEKAKEIMNTGGKVSREEALRCRVRYFTDGAVLGSKEFVQSFFEENLDRFGAKRRDGPRPLKGSDWGELACIRDLRREVFG